MRLSGRSLSEISRDINVPKSTISVWLKDIVLSDKQLVDLTGRTSSRISRGRMNASILLRATRIHREKRVFEEAEKEFANLSKEPFFMTGLSLYWASGSKKGKSFQFTNSDRSIISLMSIWIRKYLKVEDNLIKMRNYNGNLRIDISRIDIQRRVIAWQKLLIQYYKEVEV